MKSEQHGQQSADEIAFYRSDPEHRKLNEYLSRIKDPTKRQLVIDTIAKVANVEGSLENMRQVTVAQRK